MSQQLVKKGANGRYSKVMPKSWIEAIKDKNTGQTLVEILQGFNMYFLPYNGNTSSTRCLVPTMLRKKGLWITYVKYDGNVYTEWYASSKIDDKSWGDSSNWRIGNNTLVGDITISANGNWVINGTETEFKAVGEKGNTPLLRVANNRLQVSYDLGDTYIDVTNNPVYTKFRWLATTGDTQANNVGRIQASTDEGKTWTNMSNDFTNNLHIKKYIGVNESLPTSGIVEGTIYAKGPYYAEDDTLNDNPIYRLWVYAWKGSTLAWQDNGEFTSIVAGVVQETGDSETEVMSQKAVTEKLSELDSEVSRLDQEIGENFLVVENPENSVNYDVIVIAGSEYIEKCTFDAGNLVGVIYFLDSDNNVISDPSISAERNITVPNNTARCFIRFGQSNTATNIKVYLQNKNGLIKKIEGKVDKIEGKSLSTNDFTNNYKNNVDLFADLLKNPLGEPIIGKMYNESCQLVDNSNSIYHVATDMSLFAGKQLVIKIKNAVASGRYMGIGIVNSGWLTDRAELNPTYVMGDISTYTFTIPTTGNVLVSYTKSARLVGVSIEQKNSTVYVDPKSGNDHNNGSIDAPMRTLSEAIKNGKNIILESGIYYESGIDLSLSRDIVNIITKPKSKVFIVGGERVLNTDGEIIDGSSKVYAKTIGDVNLNYKWIFQLFTLDKSTYIPDNERTAYHRGKQYRCGEIVAIKRVDSIAEVESSSDYAFFYDGENLYYSRPKAVSLSNPIYTSGGNLFVNTENKIVNANGIIVFCSTVNLHSMNDCVWENCSVFGAGSGAGFSIQNSKGIILKHCEAARTQNGIGVTGDGFNIHSTIDSTDVALDRIYTQFEMINCWAHDNNNDGYSDHEGCKGYINGGLFEHNCISGNGAGVTPSFGAHDVIENVITQNNNLHGLLYSGDGTEADKGETWGGVQIISCISRYNQGNGFAQFNHHVVSDLLNCISYGNSMHGFYGASNKGSIMRCINCKSLNNTGDNYKLVSDNIGSI